MFLNMPDFNFIMIMRFSFDELFSITQNSRLGLYLTITIFGLIAKKKSKLGQP